MARYQLRTTEYLEDIITEMAEQGWKTLKTWSVLGPTEEKDFRSFRTAVRDAMEERTRTFKLCGLSNICIDHLKSTPWSPDLHVLDANPYDRIYHLFPLKNLNDFLMELTVRSLASIENLIEPEQEEEAYTMLSAVFKLILGKYLYVDPVCGKTEFCVYSSSAPTEVWQKKNIRGEAIETILQ
jgi:hypothetical protein